MSANPVNDAPTSESLADAFSALDAGPGLVDLQGQPLQGEQAETAPQPAPGAAASPEAAPTDPSEQQPGETDIDYKARYEEAERKNQAREWSQQGRLRAAEKRLEAMQAENQRLREGYNQEDAGLKALFDNAIAQTDDPRDKQLLEYQRDAQLRQRQDARQAAAAEADTKVAEADQHANREVVTQYATQIVQTETLPELNRAVDRLAQEFDVPVEELAGLRAMIDTPANRMLVQSAPPKFVGAWALQFLDHIEQEVQQAQQRVVARNREQASAQGTYRGPVASAAAPGGLSMARNTAVRDTEDLADWFSQTG